MPQTKDTAHLQARLQNYSVEITQAAENFVIDQILPPFGCPNLSDKYVKFDRVSERIYGAGDLMAGIAYNQIRTKKGTDTAFNINVHGGETDPIDMDIEEDADAIMKSSERHTRELTTQYLINKEKYGLALCLSTTYVTNYKTGATDFDYMNVVNTSILDILAEYKEEVRKRIGMEPNIVAFGPRTAAILESNAEIKDIAKYANPQNLLTGMAIPNMLKGMRVVVPKGQYDSNAPTTTTTSTMTDLFGNYMLIAYVEPGSRESRGLGVNFFWNKKGNNASILVEDTNNGLVRHHRYRAYYTQAITNADAGELLVNPIDPSVY